MQKKNKIKKIYYDAYFNFDLFNLAGNQDRTSKPKAKTEAISEFENIVYKSHKRPSFTGWITLPLLKWIVPIQYEIHLIDLGLN